MSHTYHIKQSNLYYTVEKRKNALRNVERYSWAREQRDAACAAADGYLKLGLEAIWELVTTQPLPRSIHVHRELGSPVSGTALFKQFGHYGWQADALKRPWKVVDPVSGYVFPTNDFASFYASALDEQGVFRRERGDRRYLRNELYPDKGVNWGVDDGYGWIDESGERWTFIAYYNHWHLWYGAYLDAAKGLIPQMLQAFRDAYLLTEEAKYAEAGIVLLDRIADVYPAMDSSVYRWEEGYSNSHGLTGQGKVLGCIWETELIYFFLEAYEAFFPAVEASGATVFLQRQAEKWQLASRKQEAVDVRRNIEEGIVLQVFDAVKQVKIRGNFGMHQRALAMAAVVIGEPDRIREWNAWLVQTGDMIREPEYRLTGGNLLVTLVDHVDRDGFGDEASPMYNSLWLKKMIGVAEVLKHLPADARSDLYRHVKLKKMFDMSPALIMARRYFPHVGDTEKAGNPALIGTVEENLRAYEQYKEPIYAQYAYFLNGEKLDGIHGSIFDAEPEKVCEEIARVVREHGPIRFESQNLTGYGLAMLKADEPAVEQARGLWLYYGRNTGHGHRDSLNLGLYAYGAELLPDNGYPERADWSAPRLEWVDNTSSHNTVMVDQTKQSNSWVGRPLHYHGQGIVQLVDVEVPKAYPQTQLYRRSVFYIQMDASSAYAVDVFRIHGGSEHHYSFHAAEGEAFVEGLCLESQDHGTYAGPEVPYAEQILADPRNYTGDGFHHLYRVRKDSAPPETFSVDWKIKDTWGVGLGTVHLRLTMLGHMEDVALAEGKPPQTPGNPDAWTYMLARRGQPSGELCSQFVALIEPYLEERKIAGIEKLVISCVDDMEDEVAGVRVQYVDGRIDYILNALDPNKAYEALEGRLRFCGFAGMLRLNGAGEPEYGFLQDGSLLAWEGDALIEAPPRIEGVIREFTQDLGFSNYLHLYVESIPSEIKKESLIGCSIYVHSHGERNAVYEIRAVEMDASVLILDIGDATLVQRYREADAPEQGYVYDVEQGAKAYIPLTWHWRRS